MDRKAKKVAIFWIAIASVIYTSGRVINPALTTTETKFVPIAENAISETNFARYFRQLGVEGSIIIYDAQGDRIYQHNQQRNKKAFLPASTFKILNSLIFLVGMELIDQQLPK